MKDTSRACARWYFLSTRTENVHVSLSGCIHEASEVCTADSQLFAAEDLFKQASAHQSPLSFYFQDQLQTNATSWHVVFSAHILQAGEKQLSETYVYDQSAALVELLMAQYEDWKVVINSDLYSTAAMAVIWFIYSDNFGTTFWAAISSFEICHELKGVCCCFWVKLRSCFCPRGGFFFLALCIYRGQNKHFHWDSCRRFPRELNWKLTAESITTFAVVT